MIACADCRHVRNGTKARPQCHHPLSAKTVTDYFTGKLVTAALSIDYMRTMNDCGPDAKLFEPKEEGNELK